MKEIKNLLKIRGRNIVIQFVVVSFILAGLAVGVILVQKNQEYREKAQTLPDCCSMNTSESQCTGRYCGESPGVCKCYSNTCAWYRCSLSPQYQKCRSQGTDPKAICCPKGDWFRTACGGDAYFKVCPSNQKAFCSCSKGNTGTFNGYECVCEPQTTGCGGGGGGGGTTPQPTPRPTGGGGGTTPQPTGSACSNAKQNPGTFTAGKSGKLNIYYNAQGTGSGTFQIAVKPNATTCSLTDNSGVFNITDSTTGKVETNLDVTSGQSVCFGVYYNQSSAAQYQDATSNTCGGSLDISGNVTQAENENGTGSISSKQCWANSLTECDFNDFAILFAIGGEGPVGGLTFKLRFQGITKEANNQKVDIKLIGNGNEMWVGDEIEITNDETGAYTFSIPEAISSGTYDLLAKGHSHLQKRFTNVVYNGGDQLIDLSLDEDYQMRAGDVTDDNAITIEDVSQILSFYDTFSVSVDSTNPDMVASDVDKNGKITIQDVALVAINWSDFRVEGDN